MAHRRHPMNCCVSGCYNTSKTNGKLGKLSFFGIPDDEDRRNEWLRLIGREELMGKDRHLKTRKVCEEHFAPEALFFPNSRRILQKMATPSLRLPGVISDVILTSKLTQTGNADGIYSDDTQSHNNSSDVDEYDTDEQNKFYELCDIYLPKNLAQLIKMNRNLRYSSKKNDADYLNFCINLYQTSPKVYQMFQNILNVPTITKLLTKFVHVELNTKILEILKSVVHKMVSTERNCSAIIGFINIKANMCYNIESDKIYGLQEIDGIQYPESAGRAIVVMVRGIFSDWKLPIAYALLPKYGKNADIVHWIDLILKNIFDIGLNVRTLVHNIKDDIINLRNDAVSLEKPYFTMNGKTIYYVYDTEDLIISLRDSLFLNNFIFQENMVKYDYIVKFYNEDLSKTIPIADKLTKNHIFPNKSEKKEVKFATQLLSKTVANGLSNYIDFNYIEEEGRGTADFINKINHLFNLLNVSKRKLVDSEFNKMHKNWGALSHRKNKNFMEHMIDLFENLQVINIESQTDTTSTFKFMQGFVVTIRSISLLYDDLKSEGFDFLLTRNLHGTALSTLLKEISGNENSKSLTCLKFTSAYRKCFMSYFRKFSLEGNYVNSEKEMEKFARRSDTLEENIRQEPKSSTDKSTYIPTNHFLKICEASDEQIKIESQDYNQIDTPEKYSLLYVCGHLLNKVEENHKNCLTFQSYMQAYKKKKTEKNKPTSHSTYLRYKEYIENNPDSPVPAVPCDDFVTFVEKMDKRFHEVTQPTIPSPIAKHIFDRFSKRFAAPCICFPTMYVMKLFIRIKIFYAIRRHNRAVRSKKIQLRNPFVFHRLL